MGSLPIERRDFLRAAAAAAATGAVTPASLLAALFACSLQAAVIEIFPGQSFEAAAENLSAGDTLIVHAGEYTHTSRIAITVSTPR